MENWIILTIIISSIYSLIIGLCGTIKENVELYEKKGLIEINIKWVMVNLLTFSLLSLFCVVKYVILIVWSILISIFYIFLAMADIGNPYGYGSRGDDDSVGPYEFASNWFKGEMFLLRFIGTFFLNIWKLFTLILSSMFRWVLAPFKLMYKKFGSFFEFNFLTIGKKK